METTQMTDNTRQEGTTSLITVMDDNNKNFKRNTNLVIGLLVRLYLCFIKCCCEHSKLLSLYNLIK